MRIEGYAALFGEPDLEGDVIRAGAFRRSLRERPVVPMLLLHQPRLACGQWTSLREDGRGLFVRGEIQASAPAGLLAQRCVRAGMDGLSIGFRTNLFARRPDGRDLHDLTLIEISIVPEPMAPRARLTRVPTQEEKALSDAEGNQDAGAASRRGRRRCAAAHV